MEEFDVILLDILKIPLLWVVTGLFVLGQAYLWNVRRFGRKLIRNLFPRASKPLSARYISKKSRNKIIVRYRVPGNDPDELQIVIKSSLPGNFHLIDPGLAREFGGYLKSANNESPGPVRSLFKLVSVYGETHIENRNALFEILREIKSLGFHHIQVHRGNLILGNANVSRDVLERESDLLELKRTIDQMVDAGLKLQSFLKENLSFDKRISGAVVMCLIAFWVIGGLCGLWIVGDLYPLLDESQTIVPWLGVTGIFCILFYLILSIVKKPDSVVLRVLSGFFLAICTSFGFAGPALYYNAQYDRSEAHCVEGKVSELIKFNVSSTKALALFWLLGDRYGDRVKSFLAVPRINVTLRNGHAHQFSIPEKLWTTLQPNDRVEILIGQGALGWQWIASMRPVELSIRNCLTETPQPNEDSNVSPIESNDKLARYSDPNPRIES